MNWKILGYLSLALIVPLLIVWFIDSSDYGETIVFSKEKKPVEVIEVDELFGAETKSTKWVDGFWLGLLPPNDNVSPKIMLGVAPMGSALIVISSIAFFINKKKNKTLGE